MYLNLTQNILTEKVKNTIESKKAKFRQLFLYNFLA